MTFAVKQFFDNGGTDAIINRIVRTGSQNADENATPALAAPSGLQLEAASEGEWGNELRVDITEIEPENRPPGETGYLFNLAIKQVVERVNGDERTEILERFLNVSTDPDSKRFVRQVLEQSSLFVRVQSVADGDLPPQPGPVEAQEFTGGQNGVQPISEDYLGSENDQTGYWALEQADLFNLMVVPPVRLGGVYNRYPGRI